GPEAQGVRVGGDGLWTLRHEGDLGLRFEDVRHRVAITVQHAQVPLAVVTPRAVLIEARRGVHDAIYERRAAAWVAAGISHGLIHVRHVEIAGGRGAHAG